MPAIGFALLWAGYSLMVWGYAKVRGYADDKDQPIGLLELVKPPGYTGPWGKIIGSGSATTSTQTTQTTQPIPAAPTPAPTTPSVISV